MSGEISPGKKPGGGIAPPGLQGGLAVQECGRQVAPPGGFLGPPLLQAAVLLPRCVSPLPSPAPPFLSQRLIPGERLHPMLHLCVCSGRTRYVTSQWRMMAGQRLPIVEVEVTLEQGPGGEGVGRKAMSRGLRSDALGAFGTHQLVASWAKAQGWSQVLELWVRSVWKVAGGSPRGTPRAGTW